MSSGLPKLPFKSLLLGSVGTFESELGETRPGGLPCSVNGSQSLHFVSSCPLPPPPLPVRASHHTCTGPLDWDSSVVPGSAVPVVCICARGCCLFLAVTSPCLVLFMRLSLHLARGHCLAIEWNSSVF